MYNATFQIGGKCRSAKATVVVIIQYWKLPEWVNIDMGTRSHEIPGCNWWPMRHFVQSSYVFAAGLFNRQLLWSHLLALLFSKRRAPREDNKNYRARQRVADKTLLDNSSVQRNNLKNVPYTEHQHIKIYGLNSSLCCDESELPCFRF